MKKTLEQHLKRSYMFLVLFAQALAICVTLYFSIQNQLETLDTSISTLGYALSNSDEIINITESKIPNEELNKYLDDIIKNTNYVDIVTICDSDSIRIYHPDHTLIGFHFAGNDESDILSNSTPYIVYGEGTLGMQRRAFFAIQNSNDEIIGFVMISALLDSVKVLIIDIILSFIPLTISLIILCVIIRNFIYSKTKKILHGYNPEEFTQLFIERKEVLDSLEEGLIAINTLGEIILINKAALNMLDLSSLPKEKSLLIDIYPKTNLPNIIKTKKSELNNSITIGKNNVLSDRIPVFDNDEIIGAVSIFRNKTELLKLAENLVGTRGMIDTLRTFNHEFQNKLHVILGYLKMKKYDEISDYILKMNTISNVTVTDIERKIQNSAIAALLIGKVIRASEIGVNLNLSPDSYCTKNNPLIPTDIHITIIGNLIDNAIEELNKQNYNLKQITVGIYINDAGTIIQVDDTGGGISLENQEKIFQKNFSTKGKNRGTGLHTIKDIVQRYDGFIDLESEIGEGSSIIIKFKGGFEDV